MKSPSRLSRRDFLKLLKTVLVDSILAGLGGSLYSAVIEPLWFDVVEVPLKLPRLSGGFSGFRLVQISDIHAGEQFMPRHLGDVVGKVLELQPDAVVITGDFVYSSPKMSEQILRLTGRVLSRLSEAAPVFAVMGNHDHWWDVGRVRGMLRESNVRELTNDFLTLERGAGLLHICGVDDYYERRAKLAPILSRLPQEGCAILMAHEPDFADKSSVSNRFDLQISGHSHGRQVVIPFYGPPVLPRHGRKYPSGLYRVGEMIQYTNRGLGMVFPYVRFMCRPEVTLFVLDPP
jgi:hypothetical protein